MTAKSSWDRKTSLRMASDLPLEAIAAQARAIIERGCTADSAGPDDEPGEDPVLLLASGRQARSSSDGPPESSPEPRRLWTLDELKLFIKCHQPCFVLRQAHLGRLQNAWRCTAIRRASYWQSTHCVGHTAAVLVLRFVSSFPLR